MEAIRVMIAGATGKTGQEVAKAISNEPDLYLVAALGGKSAGRELGELVSGVRPGVRIYADLEEACWATEPQVLVDFTQSQVSAKLVPAAIQRGLYPVVGTTGQNSNFRQEVEDLSRCAGRGAVLAANFSIGIMLLNRFAREAARYFPDLEIIEMHHESKKDKPSGTAIRQIEILQAILPMEKAAIPVHSVRLPGLVAHQEVIFGGIGQVLTIKHDCLSRSSYGPGVVLAIRRVRSLDRVVYDLEELF